MRHDSTRFGGRAREGDRRGDGGHDGENHVAKTDPTGEIRSMEDTHISGWKARQFDLVFLDPPTWSTSSHGAVDLVRDYQVGIRSRAYRTPASTSSLPLEVVCLSVLSFGPTGDLDAIRGCMTCVVRRGVVRNMAIATSYGTVRLVGLKRVAWGCAS